VTDLRTAAAAFEADLSEDCDGPLRDALRAALAQSDDGKQAALEVAQRHGGTDGGHHKAWVIDQMVRALTGDGYDQFVTDTCAGEEGPDSYFWGVGIAP